jgi:hypothetical protein
MICNHCENDFKFDKNNIGITSEYVCICPRCTHSLMTNIILCNGNEIFKNRYITTKEVAYLRKIINDFFLCISEKDFFF